jgi:ribonuclease P protein component
MGRTFPPGLRVRKHSDFQRIQSAASRSGRATSAHFVFLVARSPAGVGTSGTFGPARLGLVVTKKIGCAPERNRVKRLCRECFRRWPDFVPPGVDLLVIARQGAPQLSLADVRGEWSRAQGALRHRVREVLARESLQPHVSARPASSELDDDPTPS